MAANNNPHSLTDQNANTMSPPILDHQFSTTTPLRLLVVDHDPQNLRLIQDMAFQCNYQVTTCFEGSHALNLLRESRACFDVVLCDVHMPGILDGSQLLDHVLQEFNIPVVMMCATDDESSSAVIEGMKQKGACYNLVKPLSEQDLRNIWQNVMEKTQKEVDHDDDQREGTVNKRKRSLSTERDDHDLQPNTPNKKPRFVWTQERHKMFVSAVHKLGTTKAVPKRILELMDIPELTRENVASHLQKYRMHLNKKSNVTQQTNWKPKLNREANKQVCASLRAQATTNNAQITQTPPLHHQYYSSLSGAGNIMPKQDPIIMSSKYDPHFYQSVPEYALEVPNNNQFGLINNNDIVGRNMALHHQNYMIMNLLQQQKQRLQNHYHHYHQIHSSSNLFQQSNYYPMMAPQPYDEAAFQVGMSGYQYHHQMNNSVRGSGSIAEVLYGDYIQHNQQHNLQQLPVAELEEFWDGQYTV